jgi:transcription initiation factor TFIID subunit 1
VKKTAEKQKSNGKARKRGSSEEKDAPFRVPDAKVLLEDWEDRIMWDDEGQQPTPLGAPVLLKDSDGESEDWTSQIIWEAPEGEDGEPAQTRGHFEAPGTSFALGLELATSNPYNVSNDRYYEVHAKAKSFRRLAFSHSSIQHATPALMLENPFYRTSMSVEKTRHFHRPIFKRPAEDIVLSALRPAKKRRAEVGPPRHLKELSLRDRDPFILLEYSEEYPPLLSNIGMGALIQNYYRKIDDRDSNVQELPEGEAQILEPDDRAKEDATLPFIVADVEPGVTVQGLNTNMFRAPIFRHSARGSDFLIIRHLHREKQEQTVGYFARPLETVYVVGQELPKMEVPRRQSRKLGNILKARMMAMAYRMIKQSGSRAEVDLSQIYKEFPEFDKIHVRQKLKELGKFGRKSSHTTYWRLAPGATLQSEAWMQKHITPEDVCLAQSMFATSMRFRDAEYEISDVMGEDEDEDEVEVMKEMEEELAPWNTTKNFLHSLQGKCMLQVYGEGEPTGRGEAINMLRFQRDTPVGCDANARLLFCLIMKMTFQFQFVAEDESKRKSQGESKLSVAEQRQIYNREVSLGSLWQPSGFRRGYERTVRNRSNAFSTNKTEFLLARKNCRTSE